MADKNEKDKNDEDNRTSIWSVRTEDRLQFSRIFFGLFLLGLGLVSYYEIWVRCDDTWIETVIALIRGVGAVGLASVILALIRFEGEDTIMGIAFDLYKKQAYSEFRKDIYQEIRDEIYDDAVAEGRRLEREVQRNGQSNENQPRRTH